MAGMVTAAQQGRRTGFGFLSPLLYRLARGPAIGATLPLTGNSPAAYRAEVCGAHDCGITILAQFDDESPDMLGYFGQVTLPGYDNMTGVGTPNGQDFIAALRRPGRR